MGDTYKDFCLKGILRALIIALFGIICCLPIIFIKLEMVGSPIIIMFTNIIIPAIVGSLFLIAGPYDLIIQKLESYTPLK